jgi:putative tricarboxylic transport membrane protein
MSRADRVGAILLLLFSVWFGWGARRYPYWSETGPGSGFLPFWLSLAMGILASLLFLSVSRPDSTASEKWLPRGGSLARLVTVAVATILFAASLNHIGMILGTWAFLFIVIRVIEKSSWARSITVAAGGAAGTYLLFVYWLDVPLPVGPLGF